MIIQRVLATLVACLLVASIGMGFFLQGALRQSEQAKAELVTAVEASRRAAEQREKDAATLTRLQKKNAAQSRELAKAQQGLQAALEANSEWASTFVPPAVRSSILSDSEKAAEAAKGSKNAKK